MYTLLYLKWITSTSLVVQWLQLRASTARGEGSIPGQGTKIPHAAQCSQNKRVTNKDLLYSTANSAQYYVTTQMGKELEKE